MVSSTAGAELSIIVPVYNEEDNIFPMVQEVSQAMKSVAMSYELVFVDDASTDGTWKKIIEARRQHSNVRAIKHLKNAGQSAALWTGIEATTTPLLGTLDGDLQNDPADLPKLLKEISAYDFVCGVRAKRKDTFIRRASSRVARKARKAALGVDFADTGCAFRIFKRTTLKGIFPFNGLHRFLPVLVHGGGWKTLEVPINHRNRVAGVSKYGLWNRLPRGVLDLFAMWWYQRRRVGLTPYTESKD